MSAEEEPIGRVGGLLGKLVTEAIEKVLKCFLVARRDLHADEHAAEVSPVRAVMKERDIPAPAHLLKAVHKRAGTLGELKAVENLVRGVRCAPTDQMTDVQLRHLVVGHIERRVAAVPKRSGKPADLYVVPHLNADKNVRPVRVGIAVVELGDIVIADEGAEAL